MGPEKAAEYKVWAAVLQDHIHIPALNNGLELKAAYQALLCPSVCAWRRREQRWSAQLSMGMLLRVCF